MKQRNLIVTLAIGTAYHQRWQQLCETNWRAYADTHGFDLICIDAPLDDSDRAQQRSPSWQKCLILSQDWVRDYEQVVWLDADILINPRAPSVLDGVPREKVGGIATFSAPTPSLFLEAMKRAYAYCDTLSIPTLREYTAQDYYKNFGLCPPAVHEVVQCGVLVLSPRYHRALLEKTYQKYEDKGGAQWHYEMRPLSYELLTADCVHWLEYRFNQVWMLDLLLNYPFLLQEEIVAQRLDPAKVPEVSSLRKACATIAFQNSYFLHFASRIHDMSLVDLQANPDDIFSRSHP